MLFGSLERFDHLSNGSQLTIYDVFFFDQVENSRFKRSRIRLIHDLLLLFTIDSHAERVEGERLREKIAGLAKDLESKFWRLLFLLDLQGNLLGIFLRFRCRVLSFFPLAKVVTGCLHHVVLMHNNTLKVPNLLLELDLILFQDLSVLLHLLELLGDVLEFLLVGESALSQLLLEQFIRILRGELFCVSKLYLLILLDNRYFGI